MPTNFFRLLLFVLLLSSSTYAQRMMSGVVTDIRDGRTIVVRTEHGASFVVQLGLIETPTEDQELFDIVKEHLSKFLLGKAVSFSTRTMGGVFISQVLENGTDLSRQMVRDGAAWYLIGEQPAPASSDDNDYRLLQSLAKTEILGVWAKEGLLAPSEIRRKVAASKDPLIDPETTQVARNSLGQSVEGVFGPETYAATNGNGNCSGKVVAIVDGDTVKVLNSNNREITVRLAGIDAPEKSQAYGMDAKRYLSDLIFGKYISCESSKRDRYGRVIGNISISGNSINLQMIRGCFAWHYKDYEKEQSLSDRMLYAEAEQSSRTRHCGLWQDSDAIRPSEYRKHRFMATYWNSVQPDDGASGNYGNSGGNHRPSGGGPVQVRSYTRKDGTVVKSHTRSRPH